MDDDEFNPLVGTAPTVQIGPQKVGVIVDGTGNLTGTIVFRCTFSEPLNRAPVFSDFAIDTKNGAPANVNFQNINKIDDLNYDVFIDLNAESDFDLDFVGSPNLTDLQGNQVLPSGSPLINFVVGGPGADPKLIGTKNADIFLGNGGVDTVSYASAANSVDVNFLTKKGGPGWSEGDHYFSIENVIGTRFADSLVGNDSANKFTGNAGNDGMYGGGGSDNLSGGTGNDFMLGGSGNDTLYGGAGIDQMSGGAGKDRFVFASLKDSPLVNGKADLISGRTRADCFSHGDKIDLAAIDANTKLAGNQAFKIVDHFSGKAGELLVVNASGSRIDYRISADVNGDGRPDCYLIVEGATNLTQLLASDFFL